MTDNKSITCPEEQKAWEMFILKNLFLIIEEKLSKDQKAQLHEQDCDRLYRALLDGKLKIAEMRFLSSDELFDLFVGQMRMF